MVDIQIYGIVESLAAEPPPRTRGASVGSRAVETGTTGLASPLPLLLECLSRATGRRDEARAAAAG